MNQLFVEIIPNEMPFRAPFWKNECVFCEEVFTLASFATILLALLFAVLAVIGVMYWMNRDSGPTTGTQFPTKS